METKKPLAYCEHEFAPDPITKEVRCIKCENLDDEMQVPKIKPSKSDVMTMRLRQFLHNQF
jgi:hypothetical protein